METKTFFEKCKVDWWGGYYIPVRNSISYRVIKKHLTENEKRAYENQFGEQMIMDNDFFKWKLSLYKNDN